MVRSLPHGTASIQDEIFGSLIERIAVRNQLSSFDMLQHILGADYDSRSPFSLMFFDYNDHEMLDKISNATHMRCSELKNAVAQSCLSLLGKDDFSLRYATKNIDLSRSEYDPQLRPSWCPHCLFGDVLRGRDQYLRSAWILSWRTICHKHLHPLHERCTNCCHGFNVPAYILEGQTIRLYCSHCYTPLDGQLSFDFLSERTSNELSRDTTVLVLYRQISDFENYCITRRAHVSICSNGYVLTRQFLSILNMFLRSSHFRRVRIIDHVASPWFPIRPKDRWENEDVEAPFCVSKLTERRRALALLLAWITGEFETFGFNAHDLKNALYNTR